jgi:hypothetical protein
MPSDFDTVQSVPEVQTAVTVRAFSLTLSRILTDGSSTFGADDPLTSAAAADATTTDAVVGLFMENVVLSRENESE